MVTAPVTDNTGEVGTLKAKAIAHIPAVDVNSREWEEDGPIARFFKSLFGGDASDEEEGPAESYPRSETVQVLSLQCTFASLYPPDCCAH